MPKISVITPIYNGEEFIESCIKNVIEQNCPEMEHIIVDGGSKDRTVEIVNHYSNNYPHIILISEQDKGQSDAMNKGIKLAKSEIIGFLNADDFYESNVLNRVLEIFLTLPNPSFLVGNCNVLNGKGKIVTINKPAKLGLKDILLGIYITETPCNPSAYFYHQSLHDLVGLYKIDEFYSMDIEFILRAVQSANIKYVDETWGNFLKHDDSKTQKREELDIIRGRERLYNQCVRNLPLKQQIPMYFFRAIGSMYTYYRFFYLFVIIGILTRIKYFSRHPDELITSIKKKLSR